MPRLTSDDDVLSYRGRWLGPPGLRVFQVGVYYEQLFGAVGVWVVESTALGLLLLIAGPFVALLTVLAVSALLVRVVFKPHQQALGYAVVALVALVAVFVGLPLLGVLLAPWVHAPLAGRLIGRALDGERGLLGWWRVMQAEAAAPRVRPAPVHPVAVAREPVIETGAPYL